MVLLFVCFLLWITTATTSESTDLNSRLMAADPGDTVYVESGIYQDYVIEFKNSGLKDRPIVLAARKPGHAIFMGNSQLNIDGEYLKVIGLFFLNSYVKSPKKAIINVGLDSGTKYVYLERIKIEQRGSENTSPPYSWVILKGINNGIRYCTFNGKSNRLPLISISAEGKFYGYHVIKDNVFSNIKPIKGNGLSAIRLGLSTMATRSMNCVIENNTFFNCRGEIEIISNKSTGNTFKDNIFLNSYGGLTLRAGDSCTVISNCFFGTKENKYIGVRVAGNDHKILKNAFIDIGTSSTLSGAVILMNGGDIKCGYAAAKRVVIDSNIFYKEKGLYVLNGKPGRCDEQPTIRSFRGNVYLQDNDALVPQLNLNNILSSRKTMNNGGHLASIYLLEGAETTIENYSSTIEFINDNQWEAIRLSENTGLNFLPRSPLFFGRGCGY